MALNRADIDATHPPRVGAAWRERARLGTLDLHKLLWLVALALAGAYVIVFLAQLPRNIGELAWDSSVGSGYVMSETIVKAGTGGLVVMGSTGQWAALWFGLLTARLPLHRQLWGIAPTVLFVLTVAIVGWAVARVANRRAAIFAVLLGLVASPYALSFLMSPFSHNPVYPCTALLGAYLVWLAHGERRRRLTALSVPPLLGVVAGVCLSSDVLLAASAVIPLAITAVIAGLQRDRRARVVAVSALSTAVISVPVAKITSETMGSLGYRTLPTPLKLASLSELPERTRLLWEGLKSLFNGYLGGPEGPGALHAPLGVASDVVMSLALAALLAVGVRATFGLLRTALRPGRAPRPDALARSLHIVFWVGSAATSCVAFWLAGEGLTATHYSYYETTVFAVAAVIPLLLPIASPARWLVPICAGVFFLAGLVGLGGNYLNVSAQLTRASGSVERIARANHVTFGYSNWADASGLTWGMHNRVIIRPVVECEEGATLCPGFQAYVQSWYTPGSRRSFLLVEANGVDLNRVPASLGKPLAVYSFGAMKMYIYPYDIAARFA